MQAGEDETFGGGAVFRKWLSLSPLRTPKVEPATKRKG